MREENNEQNEQLQKLLLEELHKMIILDSTINIEL